MMLVFSPDQKDENSGIIIIITISLKIIKVTIKYYTPTNAPIVYYILV